MLEIKHVKELDDFHYSLYNVIGRYLTTEYFVDIKEDIYEEDIDKLREFFLEKYFKNKIYIHEFFEDIFQYNTIVKLFWNNPIENYAFLWNPDGVYELFKNLDIRDKLFISEQKNFDFSFVIYNSNPFNGCNCYIVQFYPGIIVKEILEEKPLTILVGKEKLDIKRKYKPNFTKKVQIIPTKSRHFTTKVKVDDESQLPLSSRQTISNFSYEIHLRKVLEVSNLIDKVCKDFGLKSCWIAYGGFIDKEIYVEWVWLTNKDVNEERSCERITNVSDIFIGTIEKEKIVGSDGSEVFIEESPSFLMSSNYSNKKFVCLDEKEYNSFVGRKVILNPEGRIEIMKEDKVEEKKHFLKVKSIYPTSCELIVIENESLGNLYDGFCKILENEVKIWSDAVKSLKIIDRVEEALNTKEVCIYLDKVNENFLLALLKVGVEKVYAIVNSENSLIKHIKLLETFKDFCIIVDENNLPTISFLLFKRDLRKIRELLKK